ncbi:MAG TPA: multicopper oxidase domain-containing protein [Thermoanaerobaculia bacterium]|nr:multicopper oxidase domain-containing protein [Thermoanaerobaculia bacterium]
MADNDDVKSKEPLVPEVIAKDLEIIAQNRREFIGLVFTAASGAMLAPVFARFAEAQQSGVFCVPATGAELVPVGEIVSEDGYLQGLIDLGFEKRTITYYNSNGSYLCTQPMLRAYQGYKGFSIDPANRVTKVGIASPGPTLRAKVGDKIELIFLNRIDPGMSPQTSVVSKIGRCDTVLNSDGTEKYPKQDAKQFPNCFHASNTSNLHFHGTHTTPGGFGDNVLIGVIPNAKLDVNDAIKKSIQSYNDWKAGKNPSKWLAADSKKALEDMLKNAKNAELVEQLTSALKSNQTAVDACEWPQYWAAFYPHYFELPHYSGDPKKIPMMGQSPGTHWYHCHQHGSTSLQLINGMAGLFIITGDYDDKLLRLGGGTPEAPKIKEQVMIFQLFAEQVNLVNGQASVNTVAVNGQVLPTVSMKKGEVQWWRIANAMMRAHGIDRFLMIDEASYLAFVKDPSTMVNGQPPSVNQSRVPQLSQTAQDGVQLDWKNYNRRSTMATFTLAPGNRMDFLVKAPANPGVSYLVFWPPAGGPPSITDIRANTILKVVVAGDATDVNTKLPTQAEYPVLPADLADITAAEINGRHRTVTFSMDGGPGSMPKFYIDGKQFAEGIIDQVMLMGSAEEWTLYNTSLNGIMHPFHIHINPFQVTEIYDPSLMSEPLKLPQPWMWGDTIAIPAGVQQTDSLGNPAKDDAGKPLVTPGHIKIRSRFVDYAGKYVLHCHILGHEDRGMMQLIEVLDNRTVVKHH